MKILDLHVFYIGFAHPSSYSIPISLAYLASRLSRNRLTSHIIIFLEVQFGDVMETKGYCLDGDSNKVYAILLTQLGASKKLCMSSHHYSRFVLWSPTSSLHNIACYYIFGIPLGLLLGYTLKMGVKGIWLGMIYGTVVQTLCLFWMVYRTNWNKVVCKT